MKALYRVRGRALSARSAVPFDKQLPASNVHYAVREVLFSLRRELPRGWTSIVLEVTR